MRVEASYGSNTGNVLFLTAADRLLSSPTVLVDTDRRSPDRDIELINETYDHYVLPLSNEFARPLLRKLERFTGIIERLKIPVCVLGVGAQSNLDYSLEPMRFAKRHVRRFMSAVLDHGPSVGVRGEYTAHYLASLGFHDVEVIGCPSMFLNGPRMDVSKRSDHLASDSPVAIVGSMVRLPAMASVYRRAAAQFDNLVVVEQDDREHPDGDVRRFTDVDAWIPFLAGRDFLFGSRIHGNIAATIAGTPAYVLAHDSRTLELARYFDIPHRRLMPDLDAADLYEQADYGALNAGHAARWERMVAYLGRHGLEPVV